MAGEPFALTVTLKNSLTTKFVRNMLIKVDTGNLHIDLLEDSDIFQIDRIPAGGETELTIRFKTDSSLPAGKYPINFSFSYDSSKTLNLSSSGTALVEIRQPANMELVMPRFADSVTVGETIPVNFQVMNMGRDPMYNVRCVVSGFGFAPSNTGYIGTMNAGTSASTKIDLYIIALNASKGNENGSQYGSKPVVGIRSDFGRCNPCSSPWNYPCQETPEKSRRGISVKSRQKPFCVVAGRLSSCCVWGFTCCFPAQRPPGSSIQRSRHLLS